MLFGLLSLTIGAQESLLWLVPFLIGITYVLAWLSGPRKLKPIIHGLENLPKDVPLILGTYQVRFSDQAALLNLPIDLLLSLDWRFLPGSPYPVPITNPKARLISPKNGVREFIRVIKEARVVLRQGKSIGIALERFQPTVGRELTPQRILRFLQKGTGAKIIPVHLDQPEGSEFWYTPSFIRFIRDGSKRFPWRLMVGKPLTITEVPGNFATALQNLSLEATRLFVPKLKNAHEEFARHALQNRSKPCFPDKANPNLNLDYQKALVAITCLSDLLRQPLSDQQYVGVWLPNSTGSALANIALANLGKISVNLNYTSTPDIIQHCLQTTGSKTIITAKRFTSKVPWPDFPEIQILNLEDLLPKVSKLKKTMVFLLSLLLPPALFIRAVLKAHPSTLQDTLTIVFSSGSTGKPKGITLTHANILSNAWATVRGANVSSADCLLGALPFFHSFGYTVSLWTPLFSGASSVFQPDPRQARDIGSACKTYQCTVYLSTATFLRFCVKKTDAGDFASLRILVCGAEKMPPSLASEFESKFGLLPLEGYGCTELSPVTCINKPDIPAPNGMVLGNLVGSIGIPVPGVCVRITDPDSGTLLPAGKEGMVSVTGLNVMRGYLREPEKTANAIKDGWYITGDMGHISPEGYVTLTGRLSRFAKVGGEMVPLERIEEELHLALGTTERVCGVTCVPDAARGERIIVLYLPESLATFAMTPGQWTKSLTGKGLPNLWIPSEKDFFPVAELAVLGSGKLDLSRLKATALEIAGPKT